MKIKIAILFLSCFSLSANAQFFAGVDASVGAAKIASKKSLASDAKFGYLVGVHAGYEIINHIPVSVRLQYSYLKSDATFNEGIKGFRVPVMVGYRWTFNRLRPFINAGAFLSFGNKPVTDMPFIDGNGNLSDDIPKLDSYFGYIGQIGCGYKVTAKILLSVAAEYNHPFKNEVIYTHSEYIYPSAGGMTYPTLAFIGGSIGVSWYF